MSWRVKTKYIKSVSLLVLLVFSLQENMHSQNKNEFKLKSISKEAFKVMSGFLDYDKGMPLNVRIIEEKEDENYICEKVIFTGSHDSRVPAYFAKPKKTNTPLPTVIINSWDYRIKR